jgi:hypothetical protein
MEDGAVDPHEHFIRQRRNLILLSLSIITYKAGEVQIPKINLLGNEIPLRTPEIITFWLIVFFIYFSWRYCTACNAVSGIYQFYSVWSQNTYGLIYKTLLKKISKRTGLAQSDFYLEKDTTRDDCGGVIEDPSNEYKFNAGSHVSSLPEDKKKTLKDFSKVEICGPSLLLFKGRALLRAILTQREFSEYIFPYLLIALAISELLGIKVIEGIMQFFGAVTVRGTP